LKVSRFELEKLIENDYLNLGKKELYHGSISSIDIERFIMGLNNEDKPAFDTIDAIAISNDHIDLKQVSEILKINYETARKLANMGWFNSAESYLDKADPKNIQRKNFMNSIENIC
jgi:hypothetical protein